MDAGDTFVEIPQHCLASGLIGAYDIASHYMDEAASAPSTIHVILDCLGQRRYNIYQRASQSRRVLQGKRAQMYENLHGSATNAEAKAIVLHLGVS